VVVEATSYRDSGMVGMIVRGERREGCSSIMEDV